MEMLNNKKTDTENPEPKNKLLVDISDGTMESSDSGNVQQQKADAENPEAEKQLLVDISDGTLERSVNGNVQKQKTVAENLEPENHPTLKQQTIKLSSGKKQPNKPKKRLLKTDTPTDVETANAKMLEDERGKTVKEKRKSTGKARSCNSKN